MDRQLGVAHPEIDGSRPLGLLSTPTSYQGPLLVDLERHHFPVALTGSTTLHDCTRLDALQDQLSGPARLTRFC